MCPHSRPTVRQALGISRSPCRIAHGSHLRPATPAARTPRADPQPSPAHTGPAVLPYLDVVKRRFVGDIVEQEQGCGERDGALVPVPRRSVAKQNTRLGGP